MNNKIIQPVRGTHDYFGADMRLMQHIIQTARLIAANYGFSEMQTPIFEFSEVFHRSLGETSDVVSKETYSFTDRGGEQITLRPEFTASIVRAFISGGHTQSLPFKAFYGGAAFRYERPQKGRMRQFHQIGVECLGAKEPWQDAEIIACAAAILQALLGEAATHLVLELNTLGDVESRAAYRSVLLDYLTPYAADLSEESRVRLQKNPLRILDSKQEQDRNIVANAPNFSDYLSDAAKAWFDGLRSALDGLGIVYQVSPRLVRGLDYYTHTVFEFVSNQLGAQATVLAGGRYNGLVSQLGGGDIAGIGFAAGVERLMLLLQAQNWQPADKTIKLAAFAPDAIYDTQLLCLVNEWRAQGLTVEILTMRHFSKALKKAENIGATHFVAYGETEANSGLVRVRNLASRVESVAMKSTSVADFLL
jgi:histidyl-tRNA synthetase